MSTSAKHNVWKADMKRRIGISGELDFTATAVGQTLHIPCSHGHIVDFEIPARSHPDFVAKKMLNSGWTVGRKLTCPDHQRKKKVKAGVAGGKARAAALTPERRSEIAKAAATKRWNGQTQKESPEMPEISTKEQSPAAKRAFRYLMMELEDSYDDAKQCYNGGKTDRSIADELKISEEFVAKTRAEHFGPLGVPPELSDLRKELASVRAEAATAIDGYQKTVDTIQRRLDALCHKNGWPVQ